MGTWFRKARSRPNAAFCKAFLWDTDETRSEGISLYNWMGGRAKRLSFVLSTRFKRISDFAAVSRGLLPQRVALLADPDCVLAKLRAEGLFDEEDRFECGDIHVIEHASEPPPNALATDAEGPVDPLTVGPLENHVAGTIRSQLNLQVLRLRQSPQSLQERAVLLG